MDDFKVWSEFGLAGVVIGSLFIILTLLIRDLNRKDRDHNSHINTILEAEREERKDARKEHKETQTNLASAIERMADKLGD